VGVGVRGVRVHYEITPGANPAVQVVRDRIGIAAVLGIGVLASLCLLPWLGKSMFADEGATVYSAHLSWSNLWAQSRHVDLVLLPYYVLVHVWIIASGSIANIRALSLLAYFGTIVAIGVAGLRLGGRWCGVIAAVLTATSTLFVLKSLNARPYELSALVVTLCAISLLKWLDDARARWLWLFSVLSILATGLQLFALLAPISMLAGVLVVRPRLLLQRVRTLLAPMLLLAIAAVPWLIASTGEVSQVNWIAGSSAESRVLSEIRGPLVGSSYDFILLLIFVVIVAKLATIWNRHVSHVFVERVSRDRDILALTLSWAVLPTVILSIASVAHPIYANRYVTASVPGFALLVAFICIRVFPGNLDLTYRRWTRTASSSLSSQAMTVVGILAAVVLVTGFVNSATSLQEDLQGATRYTVQQQEIGDVVALPDHAISAAVSYYVASGARHISLWPQRGVQQRYVEGLDLSLHPYSTGHFPFRVWLLTDDSVPAVKHFRKLLREDGYVLSEVKQFTGVTLLRYSLAS
jgi:uncharacterized membrane protein